MNYKNMTNDEFAAKLAEMRRRVLRFWEYEDRVQIYSRIVARSVALNKRRPWVTRRYING